MIKKEGLFAIHNTGYLILDLFECRGKADVVYAPTAE